jgi:hypothetical protein
MAEKIRYRYFDPHNWPEIRYITNSLKYYKQFKLYGLPMRAISDEIEQAIPIFSLPAHHHHH